MQLAQIFVLASAFAASVLGAQFNIVTAGASITFGLKSSTGNGYRDHLLYTLQGNGHDVRMVGTQHGGDCYQPYNEGYPGFVIDQLNNKISDTFSKLQYPPNVIVTLVGTNDQRPGAEDVAGAPARFSDLLDTYRKLCPDCLIVASSLPPNGNPVQNKNIDAFNAAIKVIIAGRRSKGEHILFNDGNTGLTVKQDMASDEYHPDDAGYKIIGDRMAEQVQSAVALGWTKTPASNALDQ